MQRGTFKVGKIPGTLNKADVGTKHVAREDLLRHIHALGLREWHAPDESPSDVSAITNRLSRAGCQRNTSFLHISHLLIASIRTFAVVILE